MQSIFRQVLQTHRNRYKQSKRRCMWSRSIGPTWVARWIPTTSGWLRTSWGKLALQSSVQEGITHRYPQIVPSSFQRLLKPKRGNPGVGGPQKQTKGIYSTINVQYIYIYYILYYIYIYIVTRSLYIYVYIEIPWYTDIPKRSKKPKMIGGSRGWSLSWIRGQMVVFERSDSWILQCPIGSNGTH